MLHRVRWLVVLLSLVVATQAIAEEVAAPNSASDLVDQLGSNEFSVRRSAETKLTKLGIPAKDALVAGLKHDDPEVRRSSRHILANVYSLDYSQRLQAFAADKSGKEAHDLPGWKRYRTAIGHDEAARQLFVKMHEAEEGLMASFDSDPATAARSLEMRYRLVISQMSHPDQTRRREPPLGTVATLIFLATDPSLELPATIINDYQWSNIVQRPSMQKALTKGTMQEPAKRLLGLWISYPGNSNLTQYKIRHAIRYKVDAGLELGLKMLATKSLTAYMRVHGINAVGQLGGKDYSSVLALTLDDKTVCGQRVVRVKNKQTTFKTEMRDVALAWLIHLTGQDHKSYFMPNAKAMFDRLKRSPTYSISTYQLNFANADDRKKAFEKWAEWRKSNSLPEFPGDASKRWEAIVKQAKKKPQALNPAPVIAQKPVVPDKTTQPESTLEYDRQMARKLTKARQLIGESDVSEAAVLLGKVLEVKQDYVYRPDRRLTLSVGIRAEAERLVGLLPPSGLDEYRRYFGLTARSLLEQAIASADIDEVASVARRYFHTRAGQQAAYLVACHHFNGRDALTSALLFQRIQVRATDASELEPELSLQLATAWYLSGMTDRAEQVLVRMKNLYPRSTMTIDGELARIFSADANALAWLSRQIDLPAAAPVVDGWLMYRGDQTRNRFVENALPYLASEQLDAIVPPSDYQRQIDQLVAKRQKDHRPSFPTIHPLRIGQTLVSRTATSIRAWDITSRTMLWEAAANDAFVDLTHKTGHTPTTTEKATIRDGLERRLWDDHTFGTLSSNGDLVFAVEDVPFGVGADFQRLVLSPSGERRLDIGALSNFSTLTAYDLKTGKVQWEVGGPPGDKSVQSPGLFFLGPPLSMGNRLYVIADEDHRTRLLELDAATGKRSWDLTLVEQEQIPRQPFMANLPLSVFEQRAHRSGASPSSEDGVLVCPLSDGDYVGVDLTSRSVLWVYRSPQENVPANPMFGNVFQQQMLAKSLADPDDRWVDASVTIADGRVLLTPASSGKLLCLDLGTGNMLWSKSRADGYYVAGVRDGRAVIVGRSGLRSIKLSNGESAWQQEQVPLPPGAVPTGRGLLTEKSCLVPLSTGEVAAFALETGRLVARSHSRENHVPGNLIRIDDGFVSQTPTGIFLYPQLKQREAELREQLRQKPNNKQLLAELGEVLLFRGSVKESVALLSRANDAQTTSETRELLASAMIHGVRTDFSEFADLAKRAELFIQDPEMRVEYLRALAAAHERNRDLKGSFSTLLRIVGLNVGLDKLEYVVASRAVRRDRWLVARLEDLWQRADAGERNWMLSQIDISAEGNDDRTLRWFPSHPEAFALRTKVAEKFTAEKKWHEAEQMLLINVRRGNSTQQREAVGRLATLMQECGRHVAATDYLQLAATHFADDVVTGELTGSALMQKGMEEDAIRKHAAYLDQWPAGPPTAKSGKRSRTTSYYYPVRVTTESPLSPASTSIRVDSSTRTVAGGDRNGNKQWSVSVKEANTKANMYSGAYYRTARAISRGHRHVVWLESRVAVIDSSEKAARLLWTEGTLGEISSDPAVMRMRMIRAQMRGAQSLFPAGDVRPFAVCGDAVVFHQARKLVAFHIESGDVLWRRNRFAENCDLFGDEHFVFVTTPGSDEAIVLNTLDGREVSRRAIPPVEERLITVGKHVLHWGKSEVGRRLSMFDPVAGEAVWSFDFSPKARPWCTADRVAVLQPNGEFSVIDLRTGQKTNEFKVAAMPELESIYMLGDAANTLLIANKPLTPDDNGMMFGNQFSSQVATTVPVNGEVHSLDLTTNKQRWSASVLNQLISLDQPTRMPILTFANFTRNYERQENGSMTTKSHFEMLVFDKRTGNRVHKETDNNYRYPYMMTYDVDTKTKSIKIQDQRAMVDIRYGGDTTSEKKADPEQRPTAPNPFENPKKTSSSGDTNPFE